MSMGIKSEYEKAVTESNKEQVKVEYPKIEILSQSPVEKD